MSAFKVNVKWGKQKLQNLELDLSESPSVFKSQLFSLTGVPPERQKLMIGGQKVGDESWEGSRAKVKPNATFMLMGSAETLPQAPAKKTKFIEDMTESEAAAAQSLPQGIKNFGNTCYMNATLQCLKTVPELREALSRFSSIETTDAVTRELKSLYEMMESGADVNIPSFLFLRTLHVAMPQFAEKDEKTGVFRQQDAHEFWSFLVTTLSRTLSLSPSPSPSAPPSLTQGGGAAATQTRFMEQYFGVKLESSYTCEESVDESVTIETETSYQVSCFISQEIRYMQTAIKKGLEGTVEKMSPSLGRNAVYKKVSRIKRLPAYLTVQFVRFFVGKAPDTSEMVSKKILKDVKYSIKLDMFEFCTSQLQEKLLPMRSKFKELEEKKIALKAKMISEGKFLGPKQIQSAPASEQNTEYDPFHFENDPGSNNSGYYELAAVLTHQGRSSNSGHYVGWARLKEGEWVKLDDDKVSMVTEEHILKLSGGGDWHVAYMLLYAPRRLERMKESEDMSEVSEGVTTSMETESNSTDK